MYMYCRCLFRRVGLLWWIKSGVVNVTVREAFVCQEKGVCGMMWNGWPLDDYLSGM